MTTTKPNLQSCIEAICCVAFSAILIYLVASDKYLQYVTPRMKPYIYFAAAIFAIWGFYSLTKLFRRQYRKRATHCMALIIPAFMILVSPNSQISINNTGANGLLKGNQVGNFSENYNTSTELTTTVTTTNKVEPEATQTTPSFEESIDIELPDETVTEVIKEDKVLQDDVQTEASITTQPDITEPDVAENTDGSSEIYEAPTAYGDTIQLHNFDSINKTIVVDENEFFSWNFAIFRNMDYFDGYRITVKGSVFNDPDYFAEDEFSAARPLMSCCAADIQPYGIVCKYDNAAELESDSWVTVTGTLFIGQYNGNDEIQIRVDSITPAEPIDGYLYPY